ncbi:uncharacterized protein UV8b_03411 [Ustilaginoidea virens]|uniref:RNA helicase n=1 Tax=Ustilaginoidea virens TaxID=1159556 RepID=A0A1B5L7C5_USTVR|nr:uncharacterized protein UV8b_03411 [Ustilaginoidea virens]QUC19170.1 hypothetical protein UV8b_03411 [Ustilaginoidea virens]GAO19151.1 hypothetical protein UVI_02061340 [Ustilaginoidea virens]
MAPVHKRKPIEEEFITTLSDNDEATFEEEEPVSASPPKKKVKMSKKSKNSKKDEDDEKEEEQVIGLWGPNDKDDGAMNPDFEFMDYGETGDVEEEFGDWGFSGAKKAISSDKKAVNLDDIIRRQREKKNGGEGIDDSGDEAEAVNDLNMALDDGDDEVLAEDAFGMNVDSEEEEASESDDNDGVDQSNEDDQVEGDDDGDAASDRDSVATPVGHPDDDRPDDGEDEEDAEEQAKRDAFFAPEEKQSSTATTDSSSFQSMSLSRPIHRGLASLGFNKPTPIQNKTIPIALMGKDLVGGAVTGSGKTGAFLVPILERLLFRPNKIPTTRVVILTPTRELAMQCYDVGTKLGRYTDIKFTLAVGGLSLKAQEVELRLRPDIVIATPGRFIDHMRNSAGFNVDAVEILVLDEADRMLEDGFADELNEILTTLPKSRQTMLFSATMTSTVDRLIRVGLNKPVRLMVDSQKRTVATLVQEVVRLRGGREDKRMGYLAHICMKMYHERVIIFFRQKREAHRARIIFGLLGLSCAELHGSMNQSQRIASIESFRDGKVSYLLATDVASRGLDIKRVDTVINFEAPQSLETYLHRVGRTARAGRNGTAVTLVADSDRKVMQAAIKAGKSQGSKFIKRSISSAEADELQGKIDAMEEDINTIMQEEKIQKQLAQADMQLKKGENMIEHEAEIKARPKRTWFESEHDKRKAKQAGRDELNGLREGLKKKNHNGKLSNKDRKRLDDKSTRLEGGRAWKKGKGDAAAAEAKFKARGKGKGKGKGTGKAKAKGRK